MKKLILFLFLLPFFASAQIQMSQVSGLIPKLNSKADTTKVNTKQDILVSGSNIKTINGNSIVGSGDVQVVAGGGGGGADVYLSNENSSISGYKNSSPTIDASETIKTLSTTSANTIAWGEKYIYVSPVATTSIPAGFWSLHLFGYVNSSVGDSKVYFRIFKYSSGVETVLYTFSSYEINNLTQAEIIATGAGAESTLLVTDYIGIQVGFDTDSPVSKTLTYSVGNGHASYSTNPLPLRHASLRDKNGENGFQHVTTDQISTWNAKQNQINGTGFVKASGTTLSYDNSSYYPSSNPNGYTSNTGTVTSVSGFTLGTAGADVSTSVTNNTTTPLLHIDIPTASATNRGALSSVDWNRFDGKLSSFTETDPTIYAWAKSSVKPTYTASEVGALSSGTSFRTVNSVSVVGSGDISINPFPGFGTAHSVAAYGDHLHAGIYEPVFSKNTAFNKNFGTATTQIWGYDAHPTTISGYGITDIPTFGTAGLSTNYIPKWNGSNFVNSLISDDGSKVSVNGNIYSRSANGWNIIYGNTNGIHFTRKDDVIDYADFNYTGDFKLYSTTTSTSPTTGALIVNGSIGVGGKIYIGSPEQSDMDGTTINSGSISTNGGISAIKDINAGGNINAYGNVKAANLRGGTYNPSTSNLVNCTSVTISNAMFTQVGDIKSISFRINNHVVTSGITTFDIQLPISSVTTNIISTSNVHNANVTSCYVHYKNSTLATIGVSYGSAGTYSETDFTITYK